MRRSLDEVARAGGRVVRGAAEGNAVVVAELLAAHRGERQDRAARRRLHHSFTLMIQGESYRLKQSTPEHLEMRQTSSRAIMGEFKAWLDAQQARQPPMGPMGEAIGYALGQWHALTLYLTDPHLPIDNNASERALRVAALRRKNFLFVGTNEAGENLAGLYSLIATCEANGVNPVDYLADVLIRVQAHPASRIDEPLPHRWSIPPVPS